MGVCAKPRLFKSASSQACARASICVSSPLMCMHQPPAIHLPTVSVQENISKSSPLRSLPWHIISPSYKDNLSVRRLKGRRAGCWSGREGGGGIPVSSENISCPRVLVAAAGALTHQDPSTPTPPSLPQTSSTLTRTRQRLGEAWAHPYARPHACMA